MSDHSPFLPTATPRHPLTALAILVIFVVSGLLVGNFVGLALSFPLLPGEGAAEKTRMLNQVLSGATGSMDAFGAQAVLLLVQAAAAVFAFILAPLVYLRLVELRPPNSLNTGLPLWLAPALLTGLLVVAFMPFNALFIEWNRNVDLPAVFDGWESWAKNKESSLEELTKRLIQFESVPQLLLGLVVIALIPALGEELLFRGIVQPQLFKLTRNVHAAVWVTGFLFSFIHLQFYGLVPRMLLGVLFGYLYVWSGNLWYPIIGHFTNNAFTLVMYYLYQRQTVSVDIEDTASVPWSMALVAMGLTLLLLITLKNYFFRREVPA